MQRRSYYPHNQHLISTATATSSGLASSRPATPANDLRVENGGLRVEGEMRMDGGGGIMYNNNSMELNGRDEITMKEVRADHIHFEKEYP